MSSRTQWIVLSAVCVAGFLAFCCGIPVGIAVLNRKPSPIANNSPPTLPKDDKPVHIFADTRAIHNAYSARVSADRTFTGKVIVLYGVINRTRQSGKQGIVTVGDLDGSFPVQCVFDSADTIATWQTGVGFVAQGRCEGVTKDGIVLTSCKPLSEEEQRKIATELSGFDPYR